MGFSAAFLVVFGGVGGIDSPGSSPRVSPVGENPFLGGNSGKSLLRLASLREATWRGYSSF